ncbi:unnamed protein product [Coregonus sp. 'balchen']|nr:unnamed protein product [Coregonus sp. 'balchen']
MTMASYRLTYFNMRGRAELARYIFAYAGIAFEDRRVEWKDWPSIKKRKLPVLETQKIDMLFQSHAPKLLDHLQCQLGDREWLVGDSETWADLYCHVCFTTFNVLRPGFADHHPALCGLTDRVEAIPNVAKWIQSRPTTEF